MSGFVNWIGDRTWLAWAALVPGGLGAAATLLPAFLCRLGDDRREEMRR